MKRKNIWAVIPARYASTRLSGKPLQDLAGKPLIQRVYENTLSFGLFERVVVATDDQRVFAAVSSFGGDVVMTSAAHRSGSDRVWEVVKDAPCDVVCNIQGDEPFLPRKAVQSVLSLFTDSHVDVASAMYLFQDRQALKDPNCVKVVCNRENFALYFSRSIIPYNRDESNVDYFGHVGLYAYTRRALGEFVQEEKSPLEIAENLEQLRFLQNGKKIKMALIENNILGIDTPEDLQKAREILEG